MNEYTTNAFMNIKDENEIVKIRKKTQKETLLSVNPFKMLFNFIFM